MATFTDVATLIPTLSAHVDDAGDPDLARAAMMLMTDAEIVAVLEETAALERQIDQIQVLAAGVVAIRSSRERGHSGLSQSRGHRSASSFVQDITGSTKADANRRVRVGEAMLDEDDAREEEDIPSSEETGESDASVRPEREAKRPDPWHQPLKDALRDGRLTTSQFDAIRRGLGEPPVPAEADAGEWADADEAARVTEAARQAWSQAAEQLIADAADRTVEDLWQEARTIRDLLDPEGAERRFLARFENRSFRTYRGQDGQKRASIVLDDEGDAFLETLIAAALRPRRGGPRFVDAEERARAEALAEDSRTNDQLAYDLILDVLRAGVLADVESVFGARQAGVRLVQVIDADGNRASMAHTEDNLVAMPGGFADQRLCESGFVPVTVDGCGNPLDVGREQRLFTPKQRIALAIRDGGCRWRGCDRPASYCEAHHIDEWARDRGRTDIDRGVLLCRYHHMQLHHGGWRITRDGTGDFVLHDPSGTASVMHPRAPLTYAWAGIDPPPQRFRPAA